MKKKTMLTVLLSGTLLAGIAFSPAIASRHFGNCDAGDSEQRQARMAERMEHRLEKMATLLDLTEAQQQQIEAIMTVQREKHLEQSPQPCENRNQRQGLKAAASFDEVAFRAQAEKQADRRIDMQVDRMKTRQQIFALLTAEQQEKAEIFFQAQGKCDPGHGRGMKN